MQARKNSKRSEIVPPEGINPTLAPKRAMSRLLEFLSFLSVRNLFEPPKDIRKIEIEGRLKKMSIDVGRFKILKDD
jgi:hypothetical protein